MAFHTIGISAHFHDSACCLLSDGILVAAAQEERFSRRKHESGIPKQALRYCLEQGGIGIADIDCVGYYEQPWKKLGRQIWTMLPGLPSQRAVLSRFDARKPEREIREILGFDGPVHYLDHHHAHAASAFYFSGFDNAAVFTVDGVGEWATTTYGVGKDRELEIFESVDFPNSLGLFYSTITSYLGFSVNDGEYKVMGLAPYGKPRYLDRMQKMVRNEAGGQYVLDLRYFEFSDPNRIFSDDLSSLLGRSPRKKEEPIEDFHCDVARSAQCWLEEILLDKVNYLHRRTNAKDLCMAGGVALNCVANGRILRETPFERLFVQPAANDAGGALGAAVLAQRTEQPDLPVNNTFEHSYWGPSFDTNDIGALIEATGLKCDDYRGREQEMLDAVARGLADGQVVGWFHGRMEFGPRALGGRSILADPRNPGMRDRINALVKKRESFRPFAPAVLLSRLSDHFVLDHASPFMLETCQVDSPLQLPAITHVDNSARVQTVTSDTNPRFTNLIEAFERITGCPMLLNTSFNMNDEPIVCTPADALLCFLRSNIEMLVLEDFVVNRSALGPTAEALFRNVRANAPNITHRTYTLL
jgi:carbamoyltransferase